MSIDIIGVGLTVLISCVLCLILKQYRPELALTASVGFGAVILMYVALRMSPLKTALENLTNQSGISPEYFAVMLKALGVSIITGFVCDACTDAGQTALSGKAEFAGKVAIFLLCIPMLGDVIKTVKELLA